MRGRDLDGARSEIESNVIVGNYRYALIDYRKNEIFSDKRFVAFIFRVDRYRRIAEHRFRSRRRDGQVFAFLVLYGIFQIPKIRRLFRILHFGIGKRGLARRAPVNNFGALIYQTFIVKIYKNLSDGF